MAAPACKTAPARPLCRENGAVIASVASLFPGGTIVHRLRTLLCFAVLLTAAPALAQSYPSRPVHIIVPYAAGGIVDTTARLIQTQFQEALGQPVVIENRSGAAGVVGSAAVVKAPPDGYTLVMDNESHSVNAAINPKLPYDTVRDFAPIIQVVTNDRLFVVNTQVPAATLPEFVTLAKANPGKFNYAGAASPVQLSMELFKSIAGIQVTYVAYRGGAPAMQAMVANETQITLVPLVPALSYVQAGQLKALAIVSSKRDPSLPDVPTVGEAGYQNFEAPAWVGLLAPAATPRPIIEQINAMVAKIARSPELTKRFADLGMDPAAGSPDDFKRAIGREVATWTKLAREKNIVAEE